MNEPDEIEEFIGTISDIQNDPDLKPYPPPQTPQEFRQRIYDIVFETFTMGVETGMAIEQEIDALIEEGELFIPLQIITYRERRLREVQEDFRAGADDPDQSFTSRFDQMVEDKLGGPVD
jgi:hypothetical protein